MDQSRRFLVIIFFFFFSCCCALSSAQTHIGRDREGGSGGLLRRSSSFPAVFLVLGGLVLTVTFTYVICAKIHLKAAASSSSLGRSPANPVVAADGDEIPDQHLGEPEPSRGVDKSIVESIPLLRFSEVAKLGSYNNSSKTSDLECSVCLSRFEDVEMLRLLPKCKHVFHKHCLDPWLESHSGCPLCRRRVEPEDLAIFLSSTSYKLVGSEQQTDQAHELLAKSPDGQGSYSRAADERKRKRIFRRLPIIPGLNADSGGTASRDSLPSGERSILLSEMISTASPSRCVENGGRRLVKIKEGSGAGSFHDIGSTPEIVRSVWLTIAWLIMVKRIVAVLGLGGAERDRNEKINTRPEAALDNMV